ncbi:hypothetical protein [Allobaculum sp. Allo2]|uniref:hypothetical protein n=1 Tax=Allobaculum sp. Allo2 TaxID=2853432 RepID=UPI001F5FFCE1|nr:hypothetical protein [Allobaculum sp. Allo2]UNT93542.1 hypothetical protein KWG61_01740 [Allobaculum sp. Allo2]
MKSNVRSLAALLLSASLSLGTFPLFAQENTAPEEETSTVTDSSAADAANEEALKGKTIREPARPVLRPSRFP